MISIKNYEKLKDEYIKLHKIANELADQLEEFEFLSYLNYENEYGIKYNNWYYSNCGEKIELTKELPDFINNAEKIIYNSKNIKTCPSCNMKIDITNEESEREHNKNCDVVYGRRGWRQLGVYDG